MAARVSTLRAVFTAETGQAEAGFRRMSQQTQSFGSSALQTFDGLGLGLARFAGPAGVGLAVAGLAKGAIAANALREQSQNTERQLTAYAGSASAAQAATDAFVRATDGGVSRLDAMRMSSQLLGMGLANSAGEVERMARMAVLLGDKTLSVEERMSNWNAMMANQSLPRLDTYGISSGRVRQKIDELMQANANLTREQAFTNAVLEIGGEKLALLEQNGVEAASSTEQVTAAWNDLKTAAADVVNLRVVLTGAAGVLRDVTKIIEGTTPETARQFPVDVASRDVQAAEEALNGLLAERTRLQNEYNEAKALAVQLGQAEPTWAEGALADFDAQIAAARQALRDAQIELGLTRAAADDSGSSMVGLGETIGSVTAQAAEDAKKVGDAVDGVNTKLSDSEAYWQAWAGFAEAAATRASRAAWGARAAMGQAGGARSLEDWLNRDAEAAQNAYAARAAQGQRTWSYMDTFDPVAEWVKRQTAGNKTAAAHFGQSYKDAAREVGQAFLSEMQQAQQASIGLLDLRPGRGQPNAPGAGGAFEDIFRLQAFVNDGSWGETAAKFGLDRAGASAAIQKFQSGMWDASVLALIDKGKLTEQIQQAQLGKAMQDALAADLAKETGADPKIVKAMLGLPAGGDGKGAASAAGLDVSGFVPGFLAGVDKEIAASAEDLAKRGAQLWEKLGGGFVKAASNSATFKRAMLGLIEEALASALE